jgi:pyruvate/2-oxoglutarate dehydrogenase complex dihydrolipoamide dehydrogenase (E3) component
MIECDICVIGAGSGGLSVAAGASLMGARVALVEKARMGGDCLNTGCVPSKALLAAAKAAALPRKVAKFGVDLTAQVDFARVHHHVHDVIAEIAPHDSVERFSGLGVTVIRGAARFTGRSEIEVAGQRIRARFFVIATGSTASVPPLPGIDTVPFLTNESIFEQAACPRHLIVIGGGPIGVEMAQAHRRLGAAVTVLEAGRLLARDDAEAVEVVRLALRREGVALHEGVSVSRVERDGDGIACMLADGTRIAGSHLLVAAGRRASLDGLNLEAAGVAYTAKGVTADARLRSTNRRIFAVGDAAGLMQFTHAANYHAGIAIRNMLFRLPAKASHDAIPWVTYADPELAGVGLGEAAARERHGRINILRFPYAENDRAIAERSTDGFIKVIVTPRGRILGATIVGLNAGELILPWALAISQKLGIGAMAGVVAPYPTLSELGKRAAGSFYLPRLTGETVKRVVRLLARLMP